MCQNKEWVARPCAAKLSVSATLPPWANGAYVFPYSVCSHYAIMNVSGIPHSGAQSAL